MRPDALATIARLSGRACMAAASSAGSGDPERRGRNWAIALMISMPTSGRFQTRFRDRDQALAWAFIEPTANESISHKARFGKAQNWCGPSIEKAIAPESGKHLPQLRAVTCSPFWEV